MDVGVDHAGTDGVDADAFGADLFRQAESQRVDRRLGGGVVHVHGGRADARGDRRQVDDRAAGAAVLLRHALHRFARAEEAAGDVDREHALHALGRHLVDTRCQVDDAGVVYEHRDTPKLLVDLAEHAQHVALGCDVAWNRNGTRFPRQLLGGGLVMHVVQRHLVAALYREAYGRGADAAAATGDEHHTRHQRPLRNSLSRSAIVIWYQVGRPWLQLPERSVSSISRSSAFISVAVSIRLARTAAWQAIVARSSFCRPASIWLPP